MHRRAALIVACLSTLPGLSAAAGPAPQPVALPVVNLVVEARVVERSSAQRQGLGAAGGVVVGTGGSTAAAGALVVRAGSGGASAEQTQRVLVLNGASAAVRLAQLVPLRSVEWVWTPQGAGVAERTLWVDLGRGVEVRPRWSGGDAPVRLELALEAADLAAGDPARAPRIAARTEIAAPLGEWLPVARIAEGAQRAAAGPGLGVATTDLRTERSVEVRVLRP